MEGGLDETLETGPDLYELQGGVLIFIVRPSGIAVRRENDCRHPCTN